MGIREQILDAQDLRKEVVDCPEWGVKVEVRSMSGIERAETLQAQMGEDGKVDSNRLYPTLLIATIFDPETGERIFNENDADILNSKNSAVLERLAKVAFRLSGMNEESSDNAAARFPEGEDESTSQ